MNSFFIATSILLSVISMPEVPKFDIEEQLSYLAFCESSGNPKVYRANDNGSPSIGLFQFKLETWNWATARYYSAFRETIKKLNEEIVANPPKIKPIILKPGENLHLVLSHDTRRFIPDIMNPEHQRIVARAIIEDGRMADHWKVCSKKMTAYFGL